MVRFVYLLRWRNDADLADNGFSGAVYAEEANAQANADGNNRRIEKQYADYPNPKPVGAFQRYYVEQKRLL